MANYKGTIVPQEGYVEKVYFNTNLKPNEVSSILDKIKPSENDNKNNYVYIIAVNKEDTLALVYQYDLGSKYLYTVDADFNMNYIFSNGSWNDTSGVITFNGELSTTSNNFSGAAIATQNETFKKLFSITPFIVEKNILMHPKDETGKMDNNIKLFPQTLADNLLAPNGKKFKMPNVVYQESEWTGEKVPNSGTVEQIYINTSFSKETVLEILSTITFEKNEEYTNERYIYRVLSDKDEDSKIYIHLQDGRYWIECDDGHDNYLTIFDSDYEDGWEDESEYGSFEIPMFFNREAVEIIEKTIGYYLKQLPVGYQNDKLAGLFSLIPSYKTKAGFFQSKEDGSADETKPLSIGSGGGSGGGISEDRVNELIDEKIGNFLGGES